MPSLEEHCRVTAKALGSTHEQVHRWLDAFFGKAPYGVRHRHKRHHLCGIEEVRRMWGDEAAEAAKLHVEMDLMEQGWRCEVDELPRNEHHFISSGLL